MKAKVIKPVTVAIQSRFFEAIEMLILQKKLRGLQTFCKEYDLHRPKYSTIREQYSKGTVPEVGDHYKLIDIEALSYIVKDFGVSADWLLLGSGGMFR